LKKVAMIERKAAALTSTTSLSALGLKYYQAVKCIAKQGKTEAIINHFMNAINNFKFHQSCKLMITLAALR